MKNFYTYLLLFIFIIIGAYYGINNGEKIIKLHKKDLVGTYLLKFKKDFYYKLILQNDNHLILIKKSKSKTFLKKEGRWGIVYIDGDECINIKIPTFNSIDFSLGKINQNFFTRQIQIEAFSMGEFLGKEDDAFFIKQNK